MEQNVNIANEKIIYSLADYVKNNEKDGRIVFSGEVFSGLQKVLGDSFGDIEILNERITENREGTKYWLDIFVQGCKKTGKPLATDSLLMKETLGQMRKIYELINQIEFSPEIISALKSEITESVFRERLEGYVRGQGPNIDYDKILKGEGVPNYIKEIIEYHQLMNANEGEIKKAQEPSRESLYGICNEINDILFYRISKRIPDMVFEEILGKEKIEEIKKRAS